MYIADPPLSEELAAGLKPRSGYHIGRITLGDSDPVAGGGHHTRRRLVSAPCAGVNVRPRGRRLRRRADEGHGEAGQCHERRGQHDGAFCHCASMPQRSRYWPVADELFVAAVEEQTRWVAALLICAA
jgi:hypothetical protein